MDRIPRERSNLWYIDILQNKELKYKLFDKITLNVCKVEKDGTMKKIDCNNM